VNSVFIIGITFVLFFFGYKFYSRNIEKILDIKPGRKTPAYTEYDGVDYVPVKHWTVLFGHHFASISGAAPIIGPILALSIWGWGPTILWILIGVVFMGGVHDFMSLVISIRHKGISIADIAEETISRHSRYVFLWFVWFTLILIIAVFVFVCAQTLTKEPQIVVPSLGLIPLAVLVGYLLYNLKWNQALVTIAALAGLFGLILLGERLPLALGGDALYKWTLVLLGYSFIASVAPVQKLLQPRDYISSFLLVFGLVFGYVGFILTRPHISFPMFTGWSEVAGKPLWPVLFVTVACGAISGFHSLISSGTTSKQIQTETHARRIGYGGMIAEGLVAVLALLAVAAAFSGTAELGTMLSQKGVGPVGVFGEGFGSITNVFLGKYGKFFAILVLNAFILTTLDTATRIGRYLTQELFNLKNRYAATLIIVGLAGLLMIKKSYNEIWPIFGAANQLIAALALIVITSWLLSKRKSVRYTIVPAIFMLITTIAALFYKIAEYVRVGNFLLMVIAVALLGLAVFVLYEALRHISKKGKR